MARTEHRKAAAARAAGQAGDTETLRAALTEERRGYVARALSDRIKQVDAQLRALPSAPAEPKAAPVTPAKPAGAPRGSAKQAVPPPATGDGEKATSDDGKQPPAGDGDQA